MSTSEQPFPKTLLATADNSPAVEIPLTRGYVALVDPEDYDRFGALKWTVQCQKSLRYAYRNVLGSDGKLHTVYLHRLILQAPLGVTVDHINGNGLDNRKHNLRLATQAQNCRNRRPARIGKYGYIGVYSRTPKSFYGTLRLEGKRFYTSQFDNALEASIARDELAKQLHGEFAVLNHPTA